MKEILPNIYWGVIPPENDMEDDVNIYMIHDGQQTIFIDTGFDNLSSIRFFEKIFQKFDIQSKNTLLIITHYHIDHMGIAWWFQKQGIKILMLEEEYRNAIERLPLRQERSSVIYGFDDSEFAFWDKEAFTIGDYQPVNYGSDFLKEGEILSVSSYHFQVIRLCGHTRAHLALYEENMGILFAGDHILKGISPVILTDTIDQHFLDIYFRDLDRVSAFRPNYLLPGHNELLMNGALIETAIQNIKDSYIRLCDKAFSILEKAEQTMTAYQIVLAIYHRDREEMKKELSFRHYLMTQKVAACLEYLYNNGRIRRVTLTDGTVGYDKL